MFVAKHCFQYLSSRLSQRYAFIILRIVSLGGNRPEMLIYFRESHIVVSCNFTFLHYFSKHLDLFKARSNCTRIEDKEEFRNINARCWLVLVYLNLTSPPEKPIRIFFSASFYRKISQYITCDCPLDNYNITLENKARKMICFIILRRSNTLQFRQVSAQRWLVCKKYTLRSIDDMIASLGNAIFKERH